ncbi:hypothetical protein NC652_015805 [Populus alba x Populus x berolinensis]|uniref:Uncharacterized protein n=1 Tax=Populus alba x Populus x berolinensis TaxID=444605 RepID=A0AAD6QL88_9ROSI|nr:hypothetical protein NC652_015805 [Populus alba x Populus x berolinensis]KAJ6992482.1 hypothetical protein NC653_015769 [Populus alba x Populus x berolinensis]
MLTKREIPLLGGSPQPALQARASL